MLGAVLRRSRSSWVNLVSRPFATSPHLLSYELQFSVVTSDERAAGCDTNADVTLVTSTSSLSTKLIPAAGRFERASTEWFSIVHDGELGEIEELEVAPDQYGRGDGWHLNSIDVVVRNLDEPIARPQLTQFRFNEWLGGSKFAHTTDAPMAISRRPYDPSKEPLVNLYPEGRLQYPLALRHAYAALPHPDKVKQGQKARCQPRFGYAGEDAYGASIASCHAALAVADGVRSWVDQDIDSGLFSQALIQHLMHLHGEHAKRLEQSVSSLEELSTLEGWLLEQPVELIAQAYRATLAQGHQGSATLSLALFNGLSGVLTSANIGDSGLMVIRADGTIGTGGVANSTGSSLLFRSRVQEHRFGRPYQLGHHKASDAPTDAELVQIQLQPYDIIVVGSDGLFDNLCSQDICAIVADCERPWQAARALSSAAFATSMDRTADSPWAREATEELAMFYSGGKADDITVVTAEVVTADL